MQNQQNQQQQQQPRQALIQQQRRISSAAAPGAMGGGTGGGSGSVPLQMGAGQMSGSPAAQGQQHLSSSPRISIRPRAPFSMVNSQTALRSPSLQQTTSRTPISPGQQPSSSLTGSQNLSQSPGSVSVDPRAMSAGSSQSLGSPSVSLSPMSPQGSSPHQSIRSPSGSPRLVQGVRPLGHVVQSPLARAMQSPSPSQVSMPGQQRTPLTGHGSLSPSSVSPGTSADESQENLSDSESILGKRSIMELIAQIDPSCQLEDGMEHIMDDIATQFVESVTSLSCKLAKHRKSQVLEARDVALILEQRWHIRVPGFSSGEFRSARRMRTEEVPRQRAPAGRQANVGPTSPASPRETGGNDVSNMESPPGNNLTSTPGATPVETHQNPSREENEA